MESGTGFYFDDPIAISQTFWYGPLVSTDELLSMLMAGTAEMREGLFMEGKNINIQTRVAEMREEPFLNRFLPKASRKFGVT